MWKENSSQNTVYEKISKNLLCMTKDAKTFSYESRLKIDPCIERILDEFGCLYGTMERHLFRDVINKKDRNALKSRYIAQFGITARTFNGCLRLLKGKIEAVRECRIRHIEDLKKRIAILSKKVPNRKNPDAKHTKKRRLASLIAKLKILETEEKKATVSLCFGGKKLFHKQFHLEENGYASHQEWKEAWKAERCSQFFYIGSKDETAGNQSCVLTLSETGEGQVRLRLPNAFIEKYGKYVQLPVSFSYGKRDILKALKANQALSYRFKKDHKGWRVFVSFEQTRVPNVTKDCIGAIGLDINVHHIALVETDVKGNPIDKKTIPLCTYGKTKNQAKALIGDAVKEVIALAQEKQKPIVREELDFCNKKTTLREDSAKRARMLSSFHYAAFIKNLEAKAFREGVPVFSVNPAFSSTISRVKFAVRYGLSVHHGAALVLARRHYHFSESPSKCPMKVVHKHFHVTSPKPERKRGEHVWKCWKKIDRKLRAVLAALSRASPDPQYCRPG